MPSRTVWIFFAAVLASCRPASTPIQAEGLTSGDIPLQRLSDGLYVEVPLGSGRSGLFLIDTGSYRSFATLKGARKLRAAGLGSLEYNVFRTKPFSLGELRVEPIEFEPWGDNKDTMAPESDGILGLDFLARYSVGLDLRKGTMRLWSEEVHFASGPDAWVKRASGSPDGSPTVSERSELHLSYKNGIFYIPVFLDGKSVSMCPDSGSGRTFLSRKNARKLGYRSPSGKSKTSFFYGAADLEEHEIQRLAIGHIEYRDRHTIYVPQTDRELTIVGRDALAGMVMLFDFQGEKLVVSSYAKAPRRP